MAESREFEAFIEESRKIGMPDVKALEAAMDHAASFIPGGEAGAPARAALVDLLKAGQEYARAERELGEDGGTA